MNPTKNSIKSKYVWCSGSLSEASYIVKAKAITNEMGVRDLKWYRKPVMKPRNM